MREVAVGDKRACHCPKHQMKGGYAGMATIRTVTPYTKGRIKNLTHRIVLDCGSRRKVFNHPISKTCVHYDEFPNMTIGERILLDMAKSQ